LIVGSIVGSIIDEMIRRFPERVVYFGHMEMVWLTTRVSYEKPCGLGVISALNKGLAIFAEDIHLR
jgi:hypothetical protein